MSSASTTISSDLSLFSSLTILINHPSPSPPSSSPTKHASPPNLPSPYIILVTSPVTKSTFAMPEHLGHGSAIARYMYRVLLPSRRLSTCPASRFIPATITRRLDPPVVKFSLISDNSLRSGSTRSVKIESAGLMHDPITTTILSPELERSSQAFQRWKQKQSGTSIHWILDSSGSFLGRTPKREILFGSWITGEPPRNISDSLKTTWWSGITTEVSVKAKSWMIVGCWREIDTSRDFSPHVPNL